MPFRWLRKPPTTTCLLDTGARSNTAGLHLPMNKKSLTRAPYMHLVANRRPHTTLAAIADVEVDRSTLVTSASQLTHQITAATVRRPIRA